MDKRNAPSIVVDEISFPGQAGAINFARMDGKIAGMRHACPCGCGQWGWMNFEAYGFPDYWSPQPTDADDLSKLTLTPSIGFMHGYLRAGIFGEC